MKLKLQLLVIALLFFAQGIFTTVNANSSLEKVDEIIKQLKEEQKPITAFQIEKSLKMLNGDSPIVYSANNVTTSSYSGRVDVAALTSTTFVVSYRGVNVAGVQIGTLDPSTGATSYGALASKPGGDYTAVDVLSSTSFILVTRSNNPSATYAFIGTVTGNSISLGSTNTIYGGNSVDQDVVVLSSTSAVISYRLGTSPYETYIVACTISGNSVFTGSATALTRLDFSRLYKLDGNSFIITGGDNSNNGYARVATVSGNSITLGANNSFGIANYGGSAMSAAILDANKFVVFWVNATNTGDARVGTISGTTITYGSTQSIPMNRDQLRSPIAAGLSSTELVLVYADATILPAPPGWPPYYTQTTYQTKVVTADVSGTTLTFSDSTNSSVDGYSLYEANAIQLGDGFLVGLGGYGSIDAFYGGSSSVLPVEMTAFSANLKDGNVFLEWQTASEEINEGFEIERSVNGINWEMIGFVEGNGTTIELSNYTFLDKKPFVGKNYYRLKQIDFDGKFEYSDVLNIVFETKETTALQIFPNPVGDELNITNGQGVVTIYNLLGQPVKQFNVDSEQFLVNTNDLLKGQYILFIKKDNGEVMTKRFTK